jgi:hypothetical protein
MIYDLLVGWPSENLAGNYSSLTATTEDADYPATYVHDLNPARPAKLTGSSGTFVWNFGATTRIDWVTFGPHNLAGGTATIQANGTDSWGSPSLSQSMTIPANFRDLQSRHPWIDLTDKAGYTTNGYQYWRLSVATTGAPVAIGEVWLAGRKRLISNVMAGVVNRRMRPLVEHRTDYGISTVYDLGVLQRMVEGVWFRPESEQSDLTDLWHDASGRAAMFPVVTDQSGTEALFVRFDPGLDFEQQEPGIASARLSLHEVGRGLWL